MRTIILDLDYLSDWDKGEVMNAITELRCEFSNLELEIDEMFSN